MTQSAAPAAAAPLAAAATAVSRAKPARCRRLPKKIAIAINTTITRRMPRPNEEERPPRPPSTIASTIHVPKNTSQQVPMTKS